VKVCTIAVIGHVDHGKTALVRALTGIETDRLKEERERGLSIALGFAWRDFAKGRIEFVDAPGHEDFIRTTASGLTGVSAVLLVISAVDGIERQTVEHLRIATLLGIGAGVVAVTKSDLLDNAALALACDEIRRALAGGPLDGAPMVCCSAITGAGLDALNDALADVAERLAPPPPLLGALLPVDRVFSVRGSGTVVTGTLLGAPLNLGDEATIQPSRRLVTVRGLQSQGIDYQGIEPEHPRRIGGGRQAWRHALYRRRLRSVAADRYARHIAAILRPGIEIPGRGSRHARHAQHHRFGKNSAGRRDPAGRSGLGAVSLCSSGPGVRRPARRPATAVTSGYHWRSGGPRCRRVAVLKARHGAD
jgi:small GTP-binding protein